MSKTEKQLLGDRGETIVTKKCHCPKCKTEKSLKQLRANFKCADIICDFCGYLAQVKTKTVKDINKLPNAILGAAWSVQKQRMDAGIYFPLYIVLVNAKRHSIYYLPADYQEKDIFVKRKKLSVNAKRAGWQGFYYDLTKINKETIRKIL